MNQEKKTLIEEYRTANGFGYKIVFTGDDIWQDFEVYEIASLLSPENTPEFMRRGYTSIGDLTPDIKNAQVQIGGHVKWDGCMEFDMQDTPDLCGRNQVREFGNMLSDVYARAMAIMGREMADD